MSGIFSDDWKCARVTPLFKQGESFDLNNYWPISVISVVAKVFERIVYDQLYNFLNRCGIQGKTLDWFKSYLTNRTQRCSVNGCLSDFTTLKCGVPQGTGLGPLLFLIYINDLPDCLSFSITRMYADDTHITYTGSDLHLIHFSLSRDLEKLSKWLVPNRLTLNAAKAEFMLIGSRQRLLKYSVWYTRTFHW